MVRSLKKTTVSGVLTMKTSLDMFFCVCVFLLAFSHGAKGLNFSTSLRQELLQKLRDPEYITSVRPSQPDKGPVKVEVDIVLNSIGPLNESDMTWTASFYLRQEWTDPRLKLGGGSGGSAGGEVVKLGENHVERLWQPDIYFSNGKDGLRHQLSVPNRLVYVNTSTGGVLSSQRLTMVLNCIMDLVKFPHDHQICRIIMESYGYTTDDMVLRWSSKRVAADINPTAYLPDFAIGNVNTTSCSQTYATGSFPCLQVITELHREIGYYVCQTFMPSILIVILSWAAFWIDHEVAPARVSVGLLTVLTITTQLAGFADLLPKVPYVKAIDVWMSVNLLFVFTAYMEYPLVIILSRRYKKSVGGCAGKASSQPPSAEETDAEIPTVTKTTPTASDSTPRKRGDPYSNPTDNPSVLSRSASTTTRKSSSAQSPKNPPSSLPRNLDSNDTGRQLDKKARLLFPLGFAIFNVIYWIYYLT